jgi:uncharacterized protein GlcG (DUF336 family)
VKRIFHLVAITALLVDSIFAQMTSNDVATVLAQAATRAAQVSTNTVIAVVDREGFVLGVWSVGDINRALFALDVLDAITKAGTASFLSSDQHAFTSRTAGFIVQQNFPPGVKNKPPGPLVGVNFSNMSFTDVNRFKDPHTYLDGQYGGGGTNGSPVAPLALAAISGLAGSPGSVPLFKNGKLIGGVGVAGTTKGRPTGIPALDDIQLRQTRDLDEDVALAGQIGFVPSKTILGTHVLIDGIRVPYVVNAAPRLKSVLPLGTIGVIVPPYFITNSPPVAYPQAKLGGVAGEVRAPIIDDPVGGLIAGQPRLTASEVTSILAAAAARAAITRAGIRLPRGQPAQVFITVVNNPNQPGTAPAILGTFMTAFAAAPATIFSWDVAVQKARTAVFYSDNTRAFSTRTVGFLAQSLYPPGIVRTQPGPLYSVQEMFSVLPRFDAFRALDALVPVPIRVTNVLNNVAFTNDFSVDPALPNGITIFPGGFPLYRNGVLIGAIGISGDGVDQDDIIGASGAALFPPPDEIRADRMFLRGARLPYAKFPRNPSL